MSAMDNPDLRKIEHLFTELSELSSLERIRRLEQIQFEEPEIAYQLGKLFDAETDISSTADHSASIWEKVAPILENNDNNLQIDRYEIVSVIGRGGMGIVYHAVRNDAYRQDVAIKVLHAGLADATSLRRFNSERQVLAKIKHPGVARILDAGTTQDGRPFYVMELVEGLELRDWLKMSLPTLDQRLRCLIRISEAVAEAHRLLIIHRDIKPSNVRIDQSGHPKLLDFGIAKQVDGEVDTSLTLTRTRVYSPEYAAPEQIQGEDLSTAVDVYGLGVLMYVLLAGASPYRTSGLGLHDVEQAILNDEPMRLSHAMDFGEVSHPYNRDALRGDLDAIALKAIRKEPGLRYGSVQQLIDDLVRFLDNKPVAARDGNNRYRLKKFLKRNQLAVGSATVIFLLVLGLSIVSTYSAFITDQKNQEIIAERDRAQAMSDFMLSVFRSGNPFSDQNPNLTARQLLDIGLRRIDDMFSTNPDLAIYMKYPIASAYKGIGQLAKADSVLNHLYSQVREFKSEGSMEELSVLFEMAIIRDQLGDYKGADSLHKLIQVNAKNWGLDTTPKFMEAYAEHAIMNIKLNRPLDEYQAQLPINIRTLVQNGHSGTHAHIVSLMSLGSSYYYTDPKLGIPFLEEADSLFRMAGLQESSQTLMLTNNLSLFYQNSGKVDKADQSYKKLIHLVETYLSENAGYVSTVYNNYATFLKEQGRRDEAIIVLQKAYDVQIESGNPSDNNMLLIYGNLGVINQEIGNHRLALEYLEKAYEIGLRMVGEEHEFMAMIHTYNGISMAHLSMFSEARASIERGMRIRIRSGGEQNLALADSEYAFAELSILESNFSRAEAHLQRSISLLKSVHPADHQLILKSADRLIELYTIQAKNREARMFATEHLSEIQTVNPSNRELIIRYQDIIASLGGE